MSKSIRVGSIAHDILDVPQLGQFSQRNDGTPIGRRFDGLVDAQEQIAFFKPGEKIGYRRRLCNRFKLADDATDRAFEAFDSGLKVGAVQQPGIARHDPADTRRRHAILHKPQATIHSCFPRPYHSVGRVRVTNLRKLIRAYAFDAGRDRVFRRVRGGHGCLGMRGVHDLLAWVDPRGLTVGQGRDLMRPAGAHSVIAHRQKLHAAGGQKALLHDLVEMTQHL